MKLYVKIITPSELKELEIKFNIPIWNSYSFSTFYESTIILAAFKGKELKAIWVVPLMNNNNSISAIRNIRFFPYSSPTIIENSNYKRRNIFYELFRTLTTLCSSISLPMSPNFINLQVVSSLGGFVEWRHTHVAYSELKMDTISSRLRNGIKAGEKKYDLFIHRDYTQFDFDLAIKGSNKDTSFRKMLAIRLLNEERAVIISASANNFIQGGVFIMVDNDTAFLFHSWIGNNSARGMMSYLIERAIHWAFNEKHLHSFDFEGSVIHNVDYFFSGFDVEIIPYGYIHWHSQKEELPKLITESITIPGRVTIY